MAVSPVSDFVKASKSLGKEMVAANKEKAASFLDDSAICDVLGLKENTKSMFDAILTSVRTGVDKNKNSYIAFDYTLTSGKKGLVVGDFIGLPKDNKKSRESKMKIVAMKLNQLGHNLDKYDANSIMQAVEDAAKALTAEKPACTIALSRYVRPDKSSSVNSSIVSVSDSASAAEATEAAIDSGEPIDFLTLGTLADDGDADAINSLTELAGTLEVDADDYPTWSDLAAYAAEELTVASVEEVEAEEEEASDDTTEYADVEEVSDEDKAYYESCIEYPGTFLDDSDEPITGIASEYDPETNQITLVDDAGTEYTLSATLVSFE